MDRLELLDEVRAKGVLERDALHPADPARDEEDLLVLHVHAFDGPNPLGKGEQVRCAERLGGAPRTFGPVRTCVPDDWGVEALLDRGPDGEDRSESEARDRQVTPITHVNLVDLVEEVLGGVASEDV